MPEPTPVIDPARIARAVGDPGSILPRIHTSFGDDRDESVTEWATRAVLAVIANPATIPTRSTQSAEPAQPQGQTPAERQTGIEADNAAFEIALDGLRQREIGKLLAEVVALVVDATAPQLIQHGHQRGREEAAAAIQQWADTPPGPWDWPAPHVVDGAIAAARGQVDEGRARG